MNDVTALIVTFLRDEYAIECIKSLRKEYPDIKIMVGDQNKEYKPDKFLDAGANTVIRLPYDCGIPFARNRMVEICKTNYILIGDDDFYYEKESNLENLLTLAKKFDFAGGRLRQWGKLINYQGNIERKDKTLKYHRLELDPKQYKGVNYQECMLIFNFFIANKRFYKKVQWDENIKVAYEHSDFFLRVEDAGMSVAYSLDSVVTHKPEHVEFDRGRVKKYHEFRGRRTDKEYFFKKWEIDRLIDMNNNEDRLGWEERKPMAYEDE